MKAEVPVVAVGSMVPWDPGNWAAEAEAELSRGRGRSQRSGSLLRTRKTWGPVWPGELSSAPSGAGKEFGASLREWEREEWWPALDST